MIWLTWRQHRLEGLIAAMAVAIFGVVVGSLIVAAQPLLEQIRQNCSNAVSDSCGGTLMAFNARFGGLHEPLYLAFLAFPVLSGMFIGAPLLPREFEHGTDDVVWTQGITRRRWLFIKVALLGLATSVLAAIVAIAGQAWSSSVPGPSLLYNQWAYFNVQGPEFVAYALFSFALGVATGAAIGRTVAAMAVVPVGFLALRVGVEHARQDFLPPVISEVNPNSSGPSQAWIIGNQQPVDLRGNPIGPDQFDQISNACLHPSTGILPGNFDLQACWHAHGIKVLQTVQPADRFPLFQGIEAAIFLIGAIVLLALAYWVLRWTANRN